MLSIKVGDILCSMFSEQVQQIDCITTITALPFTELPIEGLVNFNGQPLLQIDVADALGLEKKASAGKKRLIVSSRQGNFALRVDEVLNLAKTKSPDKTDQKQPLRLLQVTEILPAALRTKTSTASFKNDAPPAHTAQQKLKVLLVASAGKTIALLTHNIERIQERGSLENLAQQSGASEGLTKVRDHLLPTHSLGQLLGLQETIPETLAVIVRGKQTAWALLVQKAIEIENVSQVYSSGTELGNLWYVTQDGQVQELIDANNLLGVADSCSGAPRLWYVTKDGQIQELVDANNLLAEDSIAPLITIITPQETSATAQAGTRTITEGLRVYCGSGSYLLPLAMAARTLERSNLPTMTENRFPKDKRTNRDNRIPCIDAAALFFGKPAKNMDTFAVVNLADNAQLLLGVQKLAISQTSAGAEKWKFMDLPYPAKLFFDAACYDEQSEQWVLRVSENIKFANLPWMIKKAVVKAITGWVNR